MEPLPPPDLLLVILALIFFLVSSLQRFAVTQVSPPFPPLFVFKSSLELLLPVISESSSIFLTRYLLHRFPLHWAMLSSQTSDFLFYVIFSCVRTLPLPPTLPYPLDHVYVLFLMLLFVLVTHFLPPSFSFSFFYRPKFRLEYEVPCGFLQLPL